VAEQNNSGQMTGDCYGARRHPPFSFRKMLKMHRLLPAEYGTRPGMSGLGFRDEMFVKPSLLVPTVPLARSRMELSRFIVRFHQEVSHSFHSHQPLLRLLTATTAS
jgi:hypothetical protein